MSREDRGPTVFVRERRVGSIWHVRVRAVGHDFELRCGDSITRPRSEVSHNKPALGDACRKCIGCVCSATSERPCLVCAAWGSANMNAQAKGPELDILIEAPIAPRGMDKGAAVFGGHAAVFTSSASKSWQAEFAAIAANYAPISLIEYPVRVDILAVLPRPKSMMGKKHPDGLAWCPKTPDVDNIRKNVQDALRAWWRDDKQVVCGQSLKVYAEKTGLARTIVRIRSLWHVDPDAIIAPVFGTLSTAAKQRGIFTPAAAPELELPPAPPSNEGAKPEVDAETNEDDAPSTLDEFEQLAGGTAA